MTILGDQPKFKQVRNVSGHNIVLSVNNSTKFDIGTTDTNITSNLQINGSLALHAGNAAFFYNPSDTSSVAFQANADVTTNTIYNLPPNYPSTSDFCLSSDTNGNLSWKDTTIIDSGNALTLFNTTNTFSVKLRAKPTLSSHADYKIPGFPTISGQIMACDMNGNMSWENSTSTFPSVAINDSNVVFTSSDNPRQLGCLPTAQRTYTLPPTVLSAGQPWVFYNRSRMNGNYITFNASNGALIDYAIPTQRLVLIPLTMTPTTAADWIVQEAESSWVRYIPNFSGVGLVSSSNFLYKRSREFISINGTFITGNSISFVNPAAFSLPSPFSSNLSAFSALRGQNFGLCCAELGSPVQNLIVCGNVIGSTDPFLYIRDFFNPLGTPFPAANAIFTTNREVQVFGVSLPIFNWN